MTGPRKPVIALTVGDPAGIGPEVVLRALDSADRPDVPLVVYGPLASLQDRGRRFGLKTPEELGIPVVDIPLEVPVALGVSSAAGGRAAARAVLRAAEDARSGGVDALVTAPLNKESLAAAGYPWPGHTEMLAEAAATPDVAMMFVGGGLRVALLTIHRSLRSVADAVTGEEGRRVVRLVDRELPRFGAHRRRIALCGLNPHPGENGLFGREERDALLPAGAAPRGGGAAGVGATPPR